VPPSSTNSIDEITITNSLQEDVVIVTEKYISDCLSHRNVLNPAKRYYQPDGYAQASKQPLPRPAENTTQAESSEKREGAIVMQQALKAPRAEERTSGMQISKATENFTEMQKDALADEATITLPTAAQYDDELDAAIGEAKAVEHLVGS
jgi:hypothetical protein